LFSQRISDLKVWILLIQTYPVAWMIASHHLPVIGQILRDANGEESRPLLSAWGQQDAQKRSA